MEVDFPAVMERMRRLRAEISPHDSAARFRDLGVDVYLGDAAFTGPDTVEVAGQTLTFSKACIATGGRASAPPIPGLADAGFLTNETVFSLEALPKRLAVIGAGPIGCELSQAFARFGSEVHLLERSLFIMPRDDQEAAVLVTRALQNDGVKVWTGASGMTIEAGTAGHAIRFDHEGGLGLGEEATAQEIVVDEILVAAGRQPNVEGLGLEAAGVRFDTRRGIEVDDHLRTSNKRIFAAGDVGFATSSRTRPITLHAS